MKEVSKTETLTVLDDAPLSWSGGHVGRRLTEAMRTLRMLPMPGSAAIAATGRPIRYEWEDLLAQQEQGELERTQATQNRIRLLPSYRDVTRMEAAISWPAAFLNGTVLACAVNLVSFAHSLELDAGWVSAKRGGDPELWRIKHDRGCSLIATALQRDRVPVF